MTRARRGITLRLRLAISIVVVALAGLLVLGVASALAEVAHVFEGSFGSDGTGAGQFENPGAVAVDQFTGAVYV